MLEQWRRVAAPIICDIVGFAGCSLIVYGVWLGYAPAAYIVAGLMLACGAFALAGKRE